MIFSSNYIRKNFSNIKLPNNQLVTDPNVTNENNFSGKRISTSANNNELVCTVTEAVSGTNQISNRLCYSFPMINNHYYYIGFSIYYSNTNSVIPTESFCSLAYSDSSIFTTISNFIPQAGEWVRVECAVQYTQTSYTPTAQNTIYGLWIGLKGNQSSAIGDTYKIKDINIIDLTTLYGANKEKSLLEFRQEYSVLTYPYIQDPNRGLKAKRYDVNILTTTTLSNSNPIILVSNDLDIANAYIDNYNFTISLVPKDFTYNFSDVQYHDIISIHTSDNIIGATGSNYHILYNYVSSSAFSHQTMTGSTPKGAHSELMQLSVDSDGNISLYGNSEWRILANDYDLIVSWN